MLATHAVTRAGTRLVSLRVLAAQAGTGAMLGYVIRSCLKPIMSWETLWFFEREISATSLRENRARIPLEVCLAEPEQVRRLQDFLPQRGRWSEAVQARLARGDRCFIGLSDGRPVHFSWLAGAGTTHWISEISATLRVAPGEMYLYDSFTDEAVRGKGVLPAVMSFVQRYEHRQGHRRHIFYVSRDNFSSRNTLGKSTGMLPIRKRTVRCFRFAGVKHVLIAGVDGPGSPRLEPVGARVRSLGRLGYWVRPRPAAGRNPRSWAS
jgi:hypothetical protein